MYTRKAVLVFCLLFSSHLFGGEFRVVEKHKIARISGIDRHQNWCDLSLDGRFVLCGFDLLYGENHRTKVTLMSDAYQYRIKKTRISKDGEFIAILCSNGKGYSELFLWKRDNNGRYRKIFLARQDCCINTSVRSFDMTHCGRLFLLVSCADKNDYLANVYLASIKLDQRNDGSLACHCPPDFFCKHSISKIYDINFLKQRDTEVLFLVKGNRPGRGIVSCDFQRDILKVVAWDKKACFMRSHYSEMGDFKIFYYQDELLMYDFEDRKVLPSPEDYDLRIEIPEGDKIFRSHFCEDYHHEDGGILRLLCMNDEGVLTFLEELVYFTGGPEEYFTDLDGS